MQMLKDVDITTDGEYAKNGEVKLVMTVEQLDKLAEVLDTCVDRDTVALDWDEPQTAEFVDSLVSAIRSARKETV